MNFFLAYLVEHENNFSIIYSNFQYFDNYFGDKGGSGYSIEKLAKEHNIQKNISFDSEAGMFVPILKIKKIY